MIIAHRINPYRDAPTLALLTARECLGWDRADVAANAADWAFPAESAAFLDMRAGEIAAELARRERLRSHPLSPAWPSPRHDLNDIRERVGLAAYIAKMSATTFTPRGPRLWASCPFPDHHDADPSFCIGPDPTLWHCFGCQRGGDVFTFCQEIHGGIAFAAALALLTEEAGIRRIMAPAADLRPSQRPNTRFELVGGRVAVS